MLKVLDELNKFLRFPSSHLLDDMVHTFGIVVSPKDAGQPVWSEACLEVGEKSLLDAAYVLGCRRVISQQVADHLLAFNRIPGAAELSFRVK